MTKLFADTDVVIDFLTHRKPFAKEIEQIFQNATEGKLRIYVSSVTIVNVNYIIGKLESTTKALNKTKKIMEMVHVLNVGETTVKTASISDFKDFEDAVQNACAEESKINLLVTRNVKDYRKSDLSILTPKEFLAMTKI